MDGGLLVGNSHADGGIKITTPEGKIEAEGGEVIVNKRVMALDEEFVCTGTPKDITSKINEMEGGVSWSDKGSCRIVKKAQDGTEISEDINKADAGVAVQYIKEGDLFIVTADNNDQAELIEDSINDYKDGFIDKSELENTLQSYMGDEYMIESKNIQVIGGIKHIYSEFYDGWIPFYNDEPIILDASIDIAKDGKVIDDNIIFDKIDNKTWNFEYKDSNGVETAKGIVKINETTGEFDYSVESDNLDANSDNFNNYRQQFFSKIFKSIDKKFDKHQHRLIKKNIDKAKWGKEIGSKSEEEKTEAKNKISQLVNEWDSLRLEYRMGSYSADEYVSEKKDLVSKYKPYIDKAIAYGIPVNTALLFIPTLTTDTNTKKARRGYEVVINQQRVLPPKPGSYRIYSQTNFDYPEWIGTESEIEQFVAESKNEITNYDSNDTWEENILKLGLNYSEARMLSSDGMAQASNGYFRTQDSVKRPSPSVSATIFPKGYKMEGNDGHIWEITIASNGVHRWKKVSDLVSKAEDGEEIDEVYNQAKKQFSSTLEKLSDLKVGDLINESEINGNYDDSSELYKEKDSYVLEYANRHGDIVKYKVIAILKNPVEALQKRYELESKNEGHNLQVHWRPEIKKAEDGTKIPSSSCGCDHAENGKEIGAFKIGDFFNDVRTNQKLEIVKVDEDSREITFKIKDSLFTISVFSGKQNLNNRIWVKEDKLAKDGGGSVSFDPSEIKHFLVRNNDNDGAVLLTTKRLNKASDFSVINKTKFPNLSIVAIDIYGNQKILAADGLKLDENAQMVLNQNKQIKHHSEELAEIIKDKKEVPAWVVSKINRSATDISDATHYLDGHTAEDGKYLEDVKAGTGVFGDSEFWRVTSSKNSNIGIFPKKLFSEEMAKKAYIEKYFAADGKKIMTVTKISDIPDLKEKVDAGKVTYRGLGMGKLADDFFKVAGENGTRITVDSKEYFITDTDFRKLNWDFENNKWLNKIKFSAPSRKAEDGKEITKTELWFTNDGKVVPRPMGSALEAFEKFFCDMSGIQSMELVNQNDHEYIFALNGDHEAINKLGENGVDLESYGKETRLHLPKNKVNLTLLSIRYPLLTPFANGGDIKTTNVKSWMKKSGITTEDMQWIDQIEKEDSHNGNIWLFVQKYITEDKAKEGKESITELKDYETKILPHRGKYWLFFKANQDLSVLEVELSAEPNPDHDRSSHEGTIDIPAKKFPVKSLNEARNLVRKFIMENNLGSGNWTGGKIYKNGKEVAHISYNGRVWDSATNKELI
jgi:hypothetical protein